MGEVCKEWLGPWVFHPAAESDGGWWIRRWRFTSHFRSYADPKDIRHDGVFVASSEVSR